MQDEAEITISGTKLTQAESMTVRVAIDTLANVLAEGLEEKEGQALYRSLRRLTEADSDAAGASGTAKTVA